MKRDEDGFTWFMRMCALCGGSDNVIFDELTGNDICRRCHEWERRMYGYYREEDYEEEDTACKDLL